MEFCRFVKESKLAAEPSTSFSTPRKTRPQKKRHELVEGEKHAVREIIYQFQVMKKRTPTIKGILSRMQDMEIPFTGRESTLRGIIKELGFKYVLLQLRKFV